MDTWLLSTSNHGPLEQTNLHDGHAFSSDLLLDRPLLASAGKTLQLTQQLRGAILDGRLVAGVRLPPSRVLAGELGISRSVVVKAYGDLAADGYLEARQGAGTRVRSRPGAPPPAAAPRDAPASLLQTAAPVRLLGGLPDPQVFPRAAWARHYRAALAAIPDAQLGYPDHRGTSELRGALAAYLGRVRGVTTDAARIVVCAGVTQGVALICRALHRAGARRIAVEDPCFGPHRLAIEMTGLQPVPIAVDAARGLDTAQLVEHDVAAVLLAPAHSFPTGATLDADRREAVLAWAREVGGLVIEDDYDAELRYDRTPVAALQGHAADHVAYLGSASKTFTPALRLGWIAAPSHLISALQHEKRVDDLGSSLIDQLAFARFLDSGDFARHLRRTRPIYRRRRDAATRALAHLLPHLAVTGAAAGLHLNIVLPDDTDTPALAAAAFRRGVLLEDVAPHWADAAHASPGLVLGYGTLPEHAAFSTVATIRDALEEASAR